MSRSLWWIASIGAVAYLAFLVATVPAHWAYAHLAGALQPVRLAGLQGTVWTGSAARVMLNDQNLGAAYWSLRLPALLGARLEFAVRLENGASRASARVGDGLLSAPYARNGVAELEPQVIASMLNLGGYAPAGQLSIRLEQARFPTGQLPQVDGRVQWHAARIQSPLAIRLGEINADVESSPEALRASIDNHDGELILRGQAILEPGGRYRVEGSGRAHSKSDRRLRDWLAALGGSGPERTVRIRYSGTL